MKNDDLQIIPSSGNVFADLGVPNPEVMKLRTELIVEIRRTMEEKGWTQAEAAKHLGVTHTWLNDVLHGDLEKVIIDRLVALLAKLGRKTHLKID